MVYKIYQLFFQGKYSTAVIFSVFNSKLYAQGTR